MSLAWNKTYEVYRKVILQLRLLMETGKLQIEGEVIHVAVRSCHDLTGLVQLAINGRDIGSVHALASSNKKDTDSNDTQAGRMVREIQGELFPSRDFK